MPFAGYLSSNQITALVTKAIDGDLILLGRAFYLQGIFKPFALGLPRPPGNSDLDQFHLDFINLNETERLADGQVPLVQFLKNCAAKLKLNGRAEADDFEKAANQLGNAASGVGKLPNPAQLPEVKRNEAIVGIDDMVDFPFLAGGVAVGRSVAHVKVPRFENGVAIKTASGAPWVMTGTAWMIGPQLMITNHHVINCRKSDEDNPVAEKADFDIQGANTIAEFGFDAQGSTVETVEVKAVVASSSALDYAVLRLKTDPGHPPLRLQPHRVAFNAASYLPVNIVQHPRGLPKRVAFRNNLVTGADTDTIRYFTDTDFGSSGSPVCDDNWRVLALHRGAEFVTGVTYQGKPTAYVNYGSQIQAVLEDLAARDAVLRAEIQP